MSIRLLRRGLIPLAAVLGFMAVPAVASADTLSVTPCNSGCTPNNAHFTAGGASSLTLDAALTESTITDVAADLAPGLVTNLTANPVCLTHVPGGSHASDSACQVGNGVLNGSTAVTTYETAPTSNTDAAGFDIVNSGMTIAHAELSLHQVTTGSGAGYAVGHLDLPIPVPLQTGLTHVTFNIFGTMNGRPNTRLPSNCSPPAASTLIINGTTSTAASPDVKDDSGYSSTCGTLPFTPGLTASAAKDSGDNGVAVDATITTGATDAGVLTGSLMTPSSTLTANAAALALQCSTPNATFSNCTPVGTATAMTSVVPFALNGSVYLTGSGLANITVTIHFPPPFGINLVGAQNLITNTLSFSQAAGGLNLPDIPLNSLHVHFNGGSSALFTTSCAVPNASISSSFTAQNGKSASPSAPFSVTGCAGAYSPTASGSSSGFKTGHPKLKFSFAQASTKTISISVPSGLSFKGKCKVKKSKLKCKGLKVSGGKAFSVKAKGKKLTITLSGTSGFGGSITVAGPLLKESKGLQKKVKKGTVKTITVTLKLTSVTGPTKTISVKIKAK